MRQPRCRGRRRIARLAVGAVLATVFAAASGANASEDPSTRSTALERMRGRVCTPATCAPRRPAPLQQLAGFGTAIGICALVARRRPRQPD
jgi:hypothetical protein